MNKETQEKYIQFKEFYDKKDYERASQILSKDNEVINLLDFKQGVEIMAYNYKESIRTLKRIEKTLETRLKVNQNE
jgi:hypothetical protein